MRFTVFTASYRYIYCWKSLLALNRKNAPPPDKVEFKGHTLCPSGEVVVPKACAAVASLSNQRCGVSFAVTGFLMTLFVHVMNSLIDPVL